MATKMAKRCLIVVDMQNDFIDGALGTKEAQAIVPKVVAKIKEYTGDADLVLFTQDTHGISYLQTQEGANLPVEHCIRGTRGHDLCDPVKELAPAANIIIKHTFGSTNLLAMLQYMPFLEQVELVGLCTDICVISNALIAKAAVPEAHIIVDASCCAGVTPATHEQALAAMKMCQISIVNEA